MSNQVDYKSPFEPLGKPKFNKDKHESWVRGALAIGLGILWFCVVLRSTYAWTETKDLLGVITGPIFGFIGYYAGSPGNNGN